MTKDDLKAIVARHNRAVSADCGCHECERTRSASLADVPALLDEVRRYHSARHKGAPCIVVIRLGKEIPARAFAVEMRAAALSGAKIKRRDVCMLAGLVLQLLDLDERREAIGTAVLEHFADGSTE